ncbi:TolB family protein [candidate division KSB1 bacterium]
MLFTILPTDGGLENMRTGILSLETSDWDTLINTESYYARFVPSLGASEGHITFMRQGVLMAVQFDLEKLKVIGNPVPLLEEINTLNNSTTGVALYDISDNGTLVYHQSTGVISDIYPVWVDRQGKEELIPNFPAGSYYYPRISPDGLSIAVTKIEGGTENIFKYDLEKQVPSYITFGESNYSPVWSSDSKYIYYSSTDEPGGIFRKLSDGSGDPEPIWYSGQNINSRSFSSDGKSLLFEDISAIRVYNTLDKKASPFIVKEFGEYSPNFSLDGKLVAYLSNESGAANIRIKSFSPIGSPIPITSYPSTMVGYIMHIVWGKDEIFYCYGNYLYTQPLEIGTTIRRAGPPQPLFEYIYRSGTMAANYDYDAQNERFLMLKRPSSIQPSWINVIVNFFGELKAKFKDENK